MTLQLKAPAGAGNSVYTARVFAYGASTSTGNAYALSEVRAGVYSNAATAVPDGIYYVDFYEGVDLRANARYFKLDGVEVTPFRIAQLLATARNAAGGSAPNNTAPVVPIQLSAPAGAGNSVYTARLFVPGASASTGNAIPLSEVRAGIYSNTSVTVANGAYDIEFYKNGADLAAIADSGYFQNENQIVTPLAIAANLISLQALITAATSGYPTNSEIATAVRNALAAQLNTISANSELSALPLSADRIEISAQSIASYIQGGITRHSMQLLGANGQPNSQAVAAQVKIATAAPGNQISVSGSPGAQAIAIASAVQNILAGSLNAIQANTTLAALPLSADRVEIGAQAIAAYIQGGLIQQRYQLFGADGQPSSQDVRTQVKL